MFLKNLIKYLSLISILIVTPSCIKYYELSKEEFPQGKDLEDNKKIVSNNIKKLYVYNQFETLAIFDTLWLSNTVRKAYVDIHCSKQGKDEQAKQALMTRQLEENKHWITFYVLADIRDKFHVSLTDKNSYWSLYLQFSDNKKVMPISIKETEIEPEYQALFNHRFNNFKRYYIVKFAASDLSGKDYLEIKKDFKLVFSSPKKESYITWSLLDQGSKNKKEKVLKDEDFYWI
ncbi:hypothetical protein K9M16_04640 [Candidatus Babeliales bacterium]|nr:hypothetical protein [Candidatus Babeliales bacterium]